MSHNTLLEKIQADAAAEVKKIKQVGQAQVQAFMSETETILKSERSAHHDTFTRELAQQELVEISKAKQQARISVQRAKREEIDALFNSVSKLITSKESHEYVTFFTKYATSVVPKQVSVTTVHAPTNRIKETADVLQAVGLSGTVATNDTITAGFIIEATDGVYDVTLERLLTEGRTELEMEIIKKVLS